MNYQFAQSGDAQIMQLLGKLNYRLIRDEGHRNLMNEEELAQRMQRWLEGEYQCVLFKEEDQVVAYLLYKEEEEQIYLRQFYVERKKRRQGIGAAAMQVFFSEIFPQEKKMRVDVLVGNKPARAFWRALGFAEYCITLEK